MGKGVTEQSENMLLLLQELAALKKAGPKARSRLKGRKEISQEMKRLAAEKKKSSSAGEATQKDFPNL